MNQYTNANMCYNCGGDYREENGRLVCANCGSYRPQNVSGEELSLLYTAFQELRLADFFDAEQKFDDIVRKFPRCFQAYWGRLMAHYGIKYEEDYDGRRIPTCYAASIESVFDTADYQQAMAYADAKSRAVYEQHAQYIERVRREWMDKASKEQPYDVFICYKESDLAKGILRTEDSVTMQNLYTHLMRKGYRVFFSRESLNDKVGEKYEPYIFNAIATAKVMLVYGSRPDYITSTWVKNEWTRYFKRMRAGEKQQGSLIVAYEGFAPNELPLALSSVQCLNAAEPSFYSDLRDAVDRFMGNASELPVQAPAAAKPVCRHSLITIPARAVSCTQAGMTEGAICALCGEIVTPPKPIDPTGHRFGEWQITKKATCTENGEYERVCACGERETQVIPSRGGHIASEEWKTVTEPAPGKSGLKAKICVMCGEHIETAEIPALPKAGPSEGLAYQVNDDGKTCTVTGQGECQDKDIVIPEEIDGYRVTDIVGGIIKEYTSGFSKDITSVTIPNSVTSIGYRAFNGCESLASVTIPNSVTFIGIGAFCGCTSLASVTIPSSVTSIGEAAFYGCTSLASVTIPNSATSINGSAFWGCTSLASVTIPNSVTSIGDWAFSHCTSLASVTIPSSVTSIGYGAFDGCRSLASVTIQSSVTSICEYAFRDCTSLASVTIPNSVTSIGEGAFHHCKSLASITIPNSVTSIGSWAFYGCTSLSNFCFYGKREGWDRIQLGDAWNGNSAISEIQCGSINLAYQINEDGKTCTVTGQGACFDTEIEIPKRIGGYEVTAISGFTGFNPNIKSVTIPNSVTSIGYRAFNGCESLASVTIPSSVTSIGGFAFDGCRSLVSVTIPSSVTSIGAEAFCNCMHIEVLELPVSVTSIGAGAFKGCTNLTGFFFLGNKKQFKQISLDKEWRKDSAIREVKCKDGVIKGLFLH